MTAKTPITVAYGDGIGPEITRATLQILEAAGAQLDITYIEVGQKMFEQGVMTGIDKDAINAIRKTGVLLKGPIFTPSGGGYKSVNVTIRKLMELYSNVRPCQSYAPFIKGLHENMDVVIVRENEEDLYAGIEHRQTLDTAQSLKLITRQGSERICRYAFEYARANGRKKVTCMVKDNIMKLTDGLFYSVFQEVAKEYPDIAQERYIVDIGAARIAASPQKFDVVVTENLYGDIISDIAAEVTGSVGLGISANIGEKAAMFEAMHGTAPDIAGQNIANPSGQLLAAIMMLVHIGQEDAAEKAHNAWLKTIEDGVHTGDIFDATISKQKVGTAEFTQAVIDRMGQRPEKLASVTYPKGKPRITLPPCAPRPAQKQELVGSDIYVEHLGPLETLIPLAQSAATGDAALQAITNRSGLVWPTDITYGVLVDQYRLRYVSKTPITQETFLTLLQNVAKTGLTIHKVDNLYTLDGKAAYSQAGAE